MKYSYIKPRKKSPFTPELQLIVSFFSITILMLSVTYLVLLYKDKQFNDEKIALVKEKLFLAHDSNIIDKKIAYIQKQKLIAERVYTQNMVLKDSIANLFDLIPERITLSQATLLKNGLILHGVTPTKDVYNFMLQAPLRSIFQRTYSSFYPAENGWLYFVSKNYMDEESEELNSEN